MELSLLKLRRLEKIIEKGDEAILEYLLETEEKVAENDAKIEELLKIVKELQEKPEEKEVEIDIDEVAQKAANLIDKDNLRGRDGDSYNLTEDDKKDIARLIKVPVVEKKTEKIIERIETPIYNTEVKEVAVADTAEDIRNKLELLKDEERLDKKAIRGLENYDEVAKNAYNAVTRVISNTRNFYQLLDVPQGYSGQAGKVLKVNASETGLEFASTSGGVGYTIGTPSGSVNSSNVTFTVTSAPVFIISDGITYFENAGYTRSLLTLTLDVPPSSYIRSFY